MAYNSIPTSKDIYIEVNGERIATAQGYMARSTRQSKSIEAFGEDEPIATVGGKIKHTVTLLRVKEDKLAEKIDFYSLSDFNIVIVKPNSKIIFTGCQWADIDHSLGLNECLTEKVTVIASRRMEV